MNAPSAPLGTGLPGILAEIAAVAGEDAALAVAAARGGTNVYIPSAPPPDHWLSRLVGHKAALAIGGRLTGGFIGGARVDLPLGPKGHAARQRAKVDRLLADNRSEREIALATGYSIRGVRRRRRMLVSGGRIKDDRQLPLI